MYYEYLVMPYGQVNGPSILQGLSPQWFKGLKYLFKVITDHRNLEYLQSAKRINPCQAFWALFFTRFQFMIS